MAFQCFKPKRFGADSLELIEVCNEIINEYLVDGYQLTTRQLYYQLVAKDLIPNNVKSYSRIKNLINDARVAGVMDWDAIVDRGRSVLTPNTWDIPYRILKAVAENFRIDHWEYQPCTVLVMCEKQALEGILYPATHHWGIPYVSNKGYASVSLLYKIGQNLKKHALNERKSVRVLYFGDHDPSGLDMDRDVADRLQMFSEATYETPSVTVTRVALTQEQIQELNPPPNPAKETDSRAKEYQSKYGTFSWELDAIEPKKLVGLLDSWVEFILFDEGGGSKEIWEATQQLEKEMLEELKSFPDKSDTGKWAKQIDKVYDLRYEAL
jgi:hypothetical protein